jgi:hypothetical protein
VQPYWAVAFTSTPSKSTDKAGEIFPFVILIVTHRNLSNKSSVGEGVTQEDETLMQIAQF